MRLLAIFALISFSLPAWSESTPQKVPSIETNTTKTATVISIQCEQEGTQGPAKMTCCPSLSKIPIIAENFYGRCSKVPYKFICAKCGDGVCGIGESKCNCPGDCKTTAEPKCSEEGNIGSLKMSCCSGLARIALSRQAANGQCFKTPGRFICAKCWNKTCDTGETTCNCPGDCKRCAREGKVVNASLGPAAKFSKCCNGFDSLDLGLAPGNDGACGNQIRAGSGILCTKKCGNGKCEGKENKCNCPGDCAGPTFKSCAPEGEMLTPSLPPQFRRYVKCCDGLTSLGMDIVPDGNGNCNSIAVGSGTLCTKKCGDGKCEGRENKCNCPSDCKSEPILQCGKEGTRGLYSRRCCPPLKIIEDVPYVNGECLMHTMEVGGNKMYICTKCGDDICGPGENKCNCPTDCDNRQIVPNNTESTEI